MPAHTGTLRTENGPEPAARSHLYRHSALRKRLSALSVLCSKMPDWERPSSPSARYVPAQPIAAAEEAPSVYLMAAMSDASAGAELLTPASSPLANVVGKATATMTSERVPHAVQQPLPVIDAVMRDNIRHSIFREDECIACICLLCKTPMSRNYLKPHFRGKQCRNAAAVAPNDLGALSDEAQGKKHVFIQSSWNMSKLDSRQSCRGHSLHRRSPESIGAAT